MGNQKYDRIKVADFNREQTKKANAGARRFNTDDKRFVNNKNASFNTVDDPIRKYIGSAEQSHPEELKRIISDLENSKVKIIRREGAMSYSPGLSIGKVGEIYVEPEASISAWKHEYQHFKDDREDGYLGYRVFQDKEKCIQREINAYQEEIDFASEIGYNDVVDELIKLRDREIEKYV